MQVALLDHCPTARGVDGVRVRVAVESAEGAAERTDTLPAEAGPAQDVLRLRRAASSGSQPGWHTVQVVVTASGWPQPKISADARVDHPEG